MREKGFLEELGNNYFSGGISLPKWHHEVASNLSGKDGKKFTDEEFWAGLTDKQKLELHEYYKYVYVLRADIFMQLIAYTKGLEFALTKGRGKEE